MNDCNLLEQTCAIGGIHCSRSFREALGPAGELALRFERVADQMLLNAETCSASSEETFQISWAATDAELHAPVLTPSVVGRSSGILGGLRTSSSGLRIPSYRPPPPAVLAPRSDFLG